MTLLSPPLTGRDYFGLRIKRRSRRTRHKSCWRCHGGAPRTAHTAETVGAAAIRRTLPPPIPFTVLLALSVLGVLLAIPAIPMPLATVGINLSAKNFLLGQNKQRVRSQAVLLAVSAQTRLFQTGLDDLPKISRKHFDDGIVQNLAKLGILPAALVGVLRVHLKIIIEGFHRFKGDRQDICLLYTSPSPRD